MHIVRHITPFEYALSRTGGIQISRYPGFRSLYRQQIFWIIKQKLNNKVASKSLTVLRCCQTYVRVNSHCFIAIQVQLNTYLFRGLDSNSQQTSFDYDSCRFMVCDRKTMSLSSLAIQLAELQIFLLSIAIPLKAQRVKACYVFLWLLHSKFARWNYPTSFFQEGKFFWC